jgi:hypothetical protein
LHKNNNFGIQDSLRVNTASKSLRGYATRFILNNPRILKMDSAPLILATKSFKSNLITTQYKTILENENFDLLFFYTPGPTLHCAFGFSSSN